MLGKQVSAVALAALLVSNCLARTARSRPSPEEFLRALPPAAVVEVTLANGSRMRGWVADVSGDGFELRYPIGSQLVKARVAFTEIHAVKQVKSVKRSHTVRNTLIIVGVAAGLVTSGVLIGRALAKANWSLSGPILGAL